MNRFTLALFALFACDSEVGVFQVDAPPLRLSPTHVLAPHDVRDCTLSTDVVDPEVGDVVRFSLGEADFPLAPDRRVTWCVGPGEECLWWLISEPGEPTAAVQLDEPGPWRVEARIDRLDRSTPTPMCEVDTQVWVGGEDTG